MILRCTARLLDLIGTRDHTLVEAAPSDEDWYAHLIWIQRRKCLLLTHTGTLFPVVAEVSKRDVRHLGPFVIGLIEAALDQEALPPDTLGTLDPASLVVARTASRSMLGFINQAAIECRHHIELDHGPQHAELDQVNRWLRRSLRHRDCYHQPLELAAQCASIQQPTPPAMNDARRRDDTNQRPATNPPRI